MRFRNRDEATRSRERRPPPLPLPVGESEPEHREEPAASSPSVERWEYQVRRIGDERRRGLVGWRRIEDLLNAEGAEGWELVAIDAETVTFKRRLPPG